MLVTDRTITNMNDLVPLLEKLVQTKEPLLIIADDVTGEALSSLVLNKMRGVLDVCAIKSPGFGDRRRGYLQDIAVLTGATFVTEQLGLSLDAITEDMLGKAARISVSKERTTMIATGAHTEEVAERIKVIRAEMEQTDSEFDKEKPGAHRQARRRDRPHQGRRRHRLSSRTRSCGTRTRSTRARRRWRRASCRGAARRWCTCCAPRTR